MITTLFCNHCKAPVAVTPMMPPIEGFTNFLLRCSACQRERVLREYDDKPGEMTPIEILGISPDRRL